MSYVKSIFRNRKKEITRTKRIKMRKYLNADALFHTMHNGFDNITDHRSGKTEIDLTDALMSGFAMFSLKDPSLFDYANKAAVNGKTTNLIVPDEKDPAIDHCFSFLNNVPLNKSNPDVVVNFIEYRQVNIKKGKTLHFCWVTDFIVTEDNMFKIMRGGRARWKIENETFNTLKNQGYNFGHNYGLEKKNLSIIYVMLMMLAFLVDQAQQICCSFFAAVWKKLHSKRALWENIRSLFQYYRIDSMETLYLSLHRGGYEQELPPLDVDSP